MTLTSHTTLHGHIGNNNYIFLLNYVKKVERKMENPIQTIRVSSFLRIVNCLRLFFRSLSRTFNSQ